MDDNNSLKIILEKFENYVEHYLCKDRPLLRPRLPNAGLGRPQRPLGQWAVGLQRVAESREAENPILVFEVLPEIRNWCDPLGPVKHWILNTRVQMIISHSPIFTWMNVQVAWKRVARASTSSHRTKCHECHFVASLLISIFAWLEHKSLAYTKYDLCG